MVLGNVGDPIITKEFADQYDNIEYHGERGELEIGGKKIIFVHTPQEAEEIVSENNYDLLIFGHTHQSEINNEEGLIIEIGRANIFEFK